MGDCSAIDIIVEVRQKDKSDETNDDESKNESTDRAAVATSDDAEEGMMQANGFAGHANVLGGKIKLIDNDVVAIDKLVKL